MALWDWSHRKDSCAAFLCNKPCWLCFCLCSSRCNTRLTRAHLKCPKCLTVCNRSDPRSECFRKSQVRARPHDTPSCRIASGTLVGRTESSAHRFDMRICKLTAGSTTLRLVCTQPHCICDSHRSGRGHLIYLKKFS